MSHNNHQITASGSRWVSDPLTRDIVARLSAVCSLPNIEERMLTTSDGCDAIHESREGEPTSNVCKHPHSSNCDPEAECHARCDKVELRVLTTEGRSLGDAVSERYYEESIDASPTLTGAVTTKDLLRPVFRWMKARNQHYDPDKAFEFAHGAVTLSTRGDLHLGIPRQPHIQPVYIFNTLVTMAQRNRSEEQARRAHQAMLALGYSPDIFAYTALMSVVGRRDAEEAYAIYRDMMGSAATRPNVVTVVTIIRCTMKRVSKEVGIPRIMSILRDAATLALAAVPAQVVGDDTEGAIIDSSGSPDTSVYVAALSAAVHYLDLNMLIDVLQLLRKSINKTAGVPVIDSEIASGGASTARYNELTYEILGKFITATRLQDTSTTDSPGGTSTNDRDPIDILSSLGLIDEEDVVSIEAHIVTRRERLEASQVRTDAMLVDSYSLVDGSGASLNNVHDKVSKSSQQRSAKCPYVDPMGCLGPSTPLPLRASVITHDLNRLAMRVSVRGSGAPVSEALSEEDFATLIHQCRKRKWSEQVPAILDFIETISTVGVSDLNVPPQPRLRATATTYDAAFESYFAVSKVDEAWELCVAIFGKEDIAPRVAIEVTVNCFTERMHELILSGFIRCGAAQYAIDAFRRFVDMPSMSISDILFTALPPFRPSRDVLVGFMRGMGSSINNVLSAISIIEDITRQESSRTALYDCRELLNTLLRSCALLGLGDKIPDVMQALVSSSSDNMRQTAIDIVASLDIDYVITILTASVAFTPNPSESMRYLLTMQADHNLLPPSLVFHSVVIEAQAQAWSKTPQTQLSATLGLGTLPFRSFMLLGAVKHVSGMREFLINVIEQFRSCASVVMTATSPTDWSWRSNISCDNPMLLSMDVFEESVNKMCDLVESGSQDSITASDHVLVRYMHGISASDARDVAGLNEVLLNNRDALIVSLFLQHLFGRFVAVKTREAKDCLSNQLAQALLECGSVVKLWRFAVLCIRQMNSYFSSDRSFVRFVQFLFQGIVSSAKSLDATFDELSIDVNLTFLSAFAEGCVGLEVFKIVNKLLSLTKNTSTRSLAADYVVRTLHLNSETPSSVVSMLRDCELLDVVDTEELERRLIDRCREKPSKAIYEYISAVYPNDSKERWSAAVRIAKLGLQLNDPIWRDFITTLLFKFHEPSASMVISADIDVILQSAKDTSAPIYVEDRSSLVAAIDDAELYGRDLFDALQITYVDNETLVDEVRSYLTAAAADAHSYAVGIDAEWRPDRLNAGGEGRSPCALLQVADERRVFIFDVLALGAGLEHFLHFLFSSKDIIKLGFSIKDDLSRLQYKFPSLRGVVVESVVDLRTHWTRIRSDPSCFAGPLSSILQGHQQYQQDNQQQVLEARLSRALALGGLSGLLHLCSGLVLDKRLQCSDWEARPLSDDQIRYAALDSRCLIDVYRVTRHW